MDDFPFGESDIPSPTREDEKRQDVSQFSEPTAEMREALALPSFEQQVDAFGSLRGHFRPEDDSILYPIMQEFLAFKMR